MLSVHFGSYNNNIIIKKIKLLDSTICYFFKEAMTETVFVIM